MVIPVMDHIDQHLATAATNEAYPLALKAALAIGKKTLNRYYGKTDHSEVYRIAMGSFILLYDLSSQSLIFFACTVLHPRHKLQYFKDAGWDPNWIVSARSIVDDEYKRSYASRDVPIQIPESNDKSNTVRLYYL
jgi:hypothetical protein